MHKRARVSVFLENLCLSRFSLRLISARTPPAFSAISFAASMPRGVKRTSKDDTGMAEKEDAQKKAKTETQACKEGKEGNSRLSTDVCERAR